MPGSVRVFLMSISDHFDAADASGLSGISKLFSLARLLIVATIGSNTSV